MKRVIVSRRGGFDRCDCGYGFEERILEKRKRRSAHRKMLTARWK
jgi:hypothetical protein